MRKQILISFLFFVFITCLYSFSLCAQEIEVVLHKEEMPDEGPYWGMSNIIFSDLGDKKILFFSEWQDIKIAGIMESNDYKPIYCIRYKSLSGETKYILDTDGDMDFRDEKILEFKKYGILSIAEVQVKIQPLLEKNYLLNYHVIISDDGYTYALINEIRKGTLNIGNKNYSIIIHPGWRGHPRFDTSESTLCLVDFNKDGEFSMRWGQDKSGKITMPEQIALTRPFFLGGKKYEVQSVDLMGTKLVLQRSEVKIATSVGFIAPEFSVYTFDGKSYNLKELLGKVILLEFWSEDCPYSERVRPWVNSIVKNYNRDDFIVLSIMLRPDESAYKTHLKKYSMSSIVVQSNEKLMKMYNPRIATPVFYIIDTEGIIKFNGAGASVIDIIEKILGDFLN